MEANEEVFGNYQEAKIYKAVSDDLDIVEEYKFDENVNKGIQSVKFNYNDQYIAAGYTDGYVRIFNTMTKKLTCSINCNPNNVETLVQSIKWRPKIDGRTNNILMAICRDRMIEIHTPSSTINI